LTNLCSHDSNPSQCRGTRANIVPLRFSPPNHTISAEIPERVGLFAPSHILPPRRVIGSMPFDHKQSTHMRSRSLAVLSPRRARRSDPPPCTRLWRRIGCSSVCRAGWPVVDLGNGNRYSLFGTARGAFRRPPTHHGPSASWCPRSFPELNTPLV